MVRPNWFFAFPIDGAFVLDLPELPATIRRYHPEDVHMTLAFLGGCGQAAAERAQEALDEQLERLKPAALDVRLGEVVPLGNERRYTVLSALLSGGRAEATEYLAA